MEIRTISFIGMFLFAGLSGSAIAYAALGLLKEKIRGQKATARTGAEESFLGMLLRRGIRSVNGVAKMALRIPPFYSYVTKVEQGIRFAGYRSSVTAIATLLLSGAVLLLIFGCLISQSFVCGGALAICLVLGVGVWANHQYEKRQNQLREAIPEALQSMKACFQVGYSLPQTIHEVRSNTTGPLSDLFGEVEGVLDMGGSSEDALKTLKEHAVEPELVFLATALEIQHKTGSSMQQVLEITRQSVADELELKRSLKTQTAQAKLSAQIVTVMPFALIGVFSLVSPGFLDPFFESAMGLVLLIAALSMQLLGISLVRRLLKVEVM